MNKTLEEVYKPPYKYYGGYIHDSQGIMVLTVRGWGHISNEFGNEKGAIIQDSFGDQIADRLNKGI